MSDRRHNPIQRRHEEIDDPHQIVVRHPRQSSPIKIIIFIGLLIFLSRYFDDLQPVFEQFQNDIKNIPITLDNNQLIKETSEPTLHDIVSTNATYHLGKTIHSFDQTDLNQVKNGMTPIMLAASKGHVEMIDLLFTQGADPNKRGSMKRTALQYAVDKNHIEAAKRLISYGAEIDAYDNGKLTPLVMAANRGHSELALYLIEQGADVNIPQIEGWTALINATAHNDEKLVKALLAAGADREHRADNGKKAMDYAMDYGFPDMAKILSE